MALLMAAFTEGHRRNRALGYWGAVGSAGAIVGQLHGGVLTTAFGRRAIFLINVPIGIVTIAAAARHLADSRSPTQPRLDVRGAALDVGDPALTSEDFCRPAAAGSDNHLR